MRRRRRLPDAIVCGADFIALGVVRELLLRGVKVPGEVRVTGLDGIVFTELCDPPITTLRQPVAAIAARGGALAPFASQRGCIATAPERSRPHSSRAAFVFPRCAMRRTELHVPKP